MSLINADARHLPIAAGTVQCCVTSPPYWGLRDYGVSGQLGLERTPDEYVAGMVAVFREVRRVLRDDGVCWINLGDSYSAAPCGSHGYKDGRANRGERRGPGLVGGLKPKDLIGIPWRVAFALQSDGWYLRSDCIWSKPNPMPESVTDRPTKAHEYVFLLSKSERYFYDAKAIAERAMQPIGVETRTGQGKKDAMRAAGTRNNNGTSTSILGSNQGSPWRNARTVWTITTQPYSGAHFATMPEALAERCILAGSRPGDLVLDPFGGSGTTARAALSLGRRAVMTELNPAYLALAEDRTTVTLGLPLEVA